MNGSLPELCKRGEAGQTIRVWVPGCATGEEAYSIAMEIDRQLALSGESREVKIFATDVDRQALAFAAAGRYPKSIAADVPPQLLERYFVEQDGAWRVGLAPARAGRSLRGRTWCAIRP